MLAWLLDPIAAGLTRIYGRSLGHDVAVVFVVAFVLTVIVATRWSRSGITAAVGVSVMSPRGTLRLLATTTPVVWRGTGGPKAVAATLAASVVAAALTVLPLVVGTWLVLDGELARGVIYTLLGYLYIWMFLGLLPIWVVAGWYEYGFWQSLLGNGLMLLALSVPEWLLARAHRAAPAAGDVTAHAAAKEGAP
jgi:hypothetical protein